MWVIMRRAILPALLAAGGLAALVYGAMFHAAPVVEERETKVTIEIPLALPPAPPPGGPWSGGGPAGSFGDAPWGGPRVLKKVVTRVDFVTSVETEPALMREVTVGGVALLASGELKRTYSGKGPALCPS